ncbi:family 20 glycosylhydrolase [Tessaracoccus massiliensis]|uniref:family 20 glycosylhydrolase n=1 Tax=Tessaracoccus massiliensis TaxID=1522311 RepID=UPI000A7A3B88|nr:family 20 glycosylhydrolase [Tessaracoccus massiliensis]
MAITRTTRRRGVRFASVLTALLLLTPFVPAQTASAEPVNLGLDRPVQSSGQEAGFAAERAFDGNIGPEDPTPPAVHNEPSASRWSGTGDPAWVSVDFGAPATLESVRIRWGNTFATDYALLGSVDGTTFTELEGGLAGVRADWTTVELSETGYRHLKVQVNSKSTQWPVSIWEIQALGTLDGEIVEPLSVNVIPKPAVSVAGDGGDLTLDEATVVVGSGEAAATAAQFAEEARPATGFPLTVAATGTANAISFKLDTSLELPGLTDEQYRLTVTSDGVTVEAPTQAGLFYGAQTLLQLMGPWVRSAEPVAQEWTLPAVEIEDGPRYQYRGFMFDVSRSFVPVDEIKEVLDEMSAHKLNVLHWHLSDDQGWRIAISNEGKVEGDPIDYSLLALRSGATAVATTQWTDLPGRTGFYDADEFAEIIAYADERHIAVVPEIDGPAHSNAILHAIPELNSEGSYPRLTEGQTVAPPITNTSVGESSLDAGNELTYTFMRHVFKQLIEDNATLVNGERYFHIGGDESHNTSDAAYRTYMERTTGIVEDLGAIPMAWNEAFNQAPEQMPDGSVIHHWVGGVSATARTLINTRDMKIVMSPAGNAYLPQVPGPGILGPAWACGGGGCGINQFYNWNPTAQAGVAEASVLGVSAAIWQEHIRSLNSLEYLMYPRLMATAEVGWTPQGERTIADFRERLTTLGTALTVEGRNFFPSDGTWELDVRGAVLPELAEDEAPGVVGWASLPNATDADVSATLEIGGETITLDATAERIYKDGVGAKFDDRQVNSIFVLTTDEALPVGEHTATITVTGKGATKTAQLPITVAAANEAPTLATLGNAVFQAGAAVSIQVVATDPDGDALTYSADGLPAGLAIDGATGLISGTTDAVGDHTVTVTVDDGNGGTATRSFTLTVTTKPTPTEPTDEPTADPTDDPTQQPTTPPVKKYVRTAPYTLAGLHRNLNGRDWNTTCEPYSQTERCRTDIWATIVVIENGQFVRKDGWAFNNLTYLPYMTREAWGANPLANTGEWAATTDQRQWKTECDTARTGRNGCRSYTFVTVYKATAKPEGGYVFSQNNEWMFNNIVMFE